MILHTARMGLRDPDVLDITRGGCDRARKAGKPAPGEFLAPSADLVFPTLRALMATKDEAARAAIWAGYIEQYRWEMLTSYRTRRGEWDALLASERRIMTCYCADPARCHRTLAAGFLAKLGANYRGELLASDVDKGVC